MRHGNGYGPRSKATAIGAALSCALCCASGASAQAQDASELPPLEVTGKKVAKKKKPAPARKPQPVQQTQPAAAVEAEPTSPQDVVTVSDAPRVGTNSTDITSQDIQRINPSDVKGLFSGEPGIQVGSSIPTSQKVYVNGIEETSLAVTVDGAMQNNKVFHHNSTNFIDPSLLKAVRVDAGVAPADAGFAALAGSIAYETKDVSDFLSHDGVGGFTKLMFNTNGDVFTNNVAAYGMSRGFEILGYFSMGRGDDFEAGNGLTVEGTGVDFYTGLGKLAYQAPTGDRFEISHERFSDDDLRPYRANFVRPPIGREPRVRPYDIDRQTTVFSYTDATPQGWWDPKVVIAHSKTEVQTPETARGSGLVTPVIGVSESFNGKAENKFSFNRGNVIAGIDFNSRSGDLYYPGADAREESDVIGGYAQARLEPLTGTRVSFGGRVDHERFTGTNGKTWEESGLSGNVSAEQDLIGRFLTAKAGYSHVWGGIPLNENFILNPGWIYENGPQPVEADNYTAGLVARHRGWTLEGTVFRTNVDNVRTPLFGTRLAPSFQYLGGFRVRDVESEGYELGAGYDWGNGFLRVKYANIDVSIDGKPADSDTGNYTASPMGEIITITGVHTFAGTGLTIGADAEIAPEYDYVIVGSPPYASYKVFNAFAEYKTGLKYDLTFRLDVRNLFDETYADRATYGQEFGIVMPLYEPGRSFLLSTTAKF